MAAVIAELKKRAPEGWYAVFPGGDEPVTYLKVPERDARLETMQKTVEGYVQWVPLGKPWETYGLVVNEEGAYKFAGQLNTRAMALFGAHVHEGTLHGPVMVTANVCM